MDTILIEGLRVFCIVGMFPHEREHEQLLLIQLRVHIPQVWHDDELEKSIDYAQVCRWIERYVQEQKFFTLEKAAQSVIMEMFSLWDLMLEVEITLRKPAAVAQADSVGVSMKRQRPVG